MSMIARFVQVEEAELARLRANPSLVEALFEEAPRMPPAFLALANTMQERVRAAGPQFMENALARLHPTLRQQLDESLRRTTSAMGADDGRTAILKALEQRWARTPDAMPASGARTILSLEKAWHGVHYLLCGEVEPGEALLSQPVLGGTPLGEDDEGFSGYGPARYFTPAEVAEFARALTASAVEADAVARFDAARMSELGIYPGWRASDEKWVVDGFRSLREFYSDAARHHRAVVTCIV